ncbi:unnamed protein product, partial [Schistosoma curassoni]|uniref:Protein arginine N-methyltransferase 7 n=2 Tax=Schistosoma TaxID=6181 RepID=A0A183JMJ1_9TREM
CKPPFKIAATVSYNILLITIKLLRFSSLTSHYCRSLTVRLPSMKTEHIFIPQFNPVVGRMQWKDVDPDYEFNQEIARSGYGDMLHDSDRNHKYRLAIEHTIKRLKQQYPQNPVHVLDIGTGTGLLSMMAVNAGADLVTACESFIPMATCALNILRNNGFSDKINIIPKRSTDLIVGVDMPCKANVLVAELFDTELIGEGALETYRHAAEHLLTLDASLIPCAAQVYLQVRIGSEVVKRVDNFTYLGSVTSSNGLVSDDISARIRKARLTFVNLRHLWRRRDIRLSIKGRVYCAAVHSVLLYGCETWPLRVEDTRKLLVFGHRCLRNIARICWDH